MAPAQSTAHVSTLAATCSSKCQIKLHSNHLPTPPEGASVKVQRLLQQLLLLQQHLVLQQHQLKRNQRLQRSFRGSRATLVTQQKSWPAACLAEGRLLCSTHGESPWTSCRAGWQLPAEHGCTCWLPRTGQPRHNNLNCLAVYMLLLYWQELHKKGHLQQPANSPVLL